MYLFIIVLLSIFSEVFALFGAVHAFTASKAIITNKDSFGAGEGITVVYGKRGSNTSIFFLALRL